MLYTKSTSIIIPPWKDPEEGMTGYGDFIIEQKISSLNIKWNRLLVSSLGDVWGIAYGGYIYKKSNGSDTFVKVTNYSNTYTDITEDVITKDIYITYYNSTSSYGIHRVDSSGANLTGITIDISEVEIVGYTGGRMFCSIKSDSNGNIYAITQGYIGDFIFKLDKVSDSFKPILDSYTDTKSRLRLAISDNNNIYIAHGYGVMRWTGSSYEDKIFSPELTSGTPYVWKFKNINNQNYLSMNKSTSPLPVPCFYKQNDSIGTFYGGTNYTYNYFTDFFVNSYGIAFFVSSTTKGLWYQNLLGVITKIPLNYYFNLITIDSDDNIYMSVYNSYVYKISYIPS